ncbi:MAG: glycosyltransferase family protein [Candidatus Eiseniibacteriota bacterium]
MLYCHDALGLGHVRRSLAIAGSALAARSDLAALLVTCSPLIDSLPIPQGLDYVKLPSARKTDDRRYAPRTLRIEEARYWALRSQLLRSAAMAFEPDLLLVDKSATGLQDELVDILHELRGSGRARLALGWRDILDSPDRIRAEWSDSGTLAWVERLYDEIWVYGDPKVFDLRVNHGLPRAIVDRMQYLGYLAPRVDPEARARARARISPDGRPVALVTAGGGEEGESLLHCYLEAARRRRLPRSLRSVVVTGPFLSREGQGRLSAAAPAGVRVLRFVPGLESLIAAADVVVGRAGYNTVCEVLGAGTPAVLVPRVLHREEQRIRARRLRELGVADSLEPDSLTPGVLAGAVKQALARGRARTGVLRIDGLQRAAQRAALLSSGSLVGDEELRVHGGGKR